MVAGRRDFIRGGALAAAAVVSSGCASNIVGGGISAGAPMRGFRCAPLDSVRVGVVGVGSRGSAAALRLAGLKGVRVAAVCDIRPECADRVANALEEKTGAKPLRFSGGAEEFRRLCDLDEIDVVYICTSWDAHAKVGLYALDSGKHAMIEVPSAMNIDECWALVEAAERNRRHCMQLENCCYGEAELLALNMCRLGLFGELLHGEAAYIHDRRWPIFLGKAWNMWRTRWNIEHAGNQYPTHGLGPIALDMGINRGDRFDYLVSVDGVQKSYEAYAKAALPPGHPGRAQRFAMADMNVTTIRTALGRTIMLQHDVSSARPYSRLNVISGTKGVLRGYPRLDVFVEDADKWPLVAPECHHEFDDAETERLRRKYMHPLFKSAGEAAAKAGGHGGMDYLMDLRWTYALRNGLPLDMDVYDLASWCAVCELSERSARSRSAPVDFPDFTRGAWKAKCSSPLMDADIDLSKI